MNALHRAAVAVLLASLSAVACTTASVAQTQLPPTPVKEKPAMDNAPTASRPAPPRGLPIEHQGVRRMQDMQAFRHGGDQRGGYLVAVDPKSGDRLWMLKVYPVTDHSAAGVESPGIYFRSMKLLNGNTQLEIENEVGGKYRVDLQKRSASWVSGPESGKP